MKIVSPYSYVPSKGKTIKGKKLVVPNQSLTLREIIQRFIRGEKVSVAKLYQYAEYNDVDLEKLQHADLVDKAEFHKALGQVSELYELQEKQKQLKAKELALIAAHKQNNAHMETGGSNKAADEGQS